MKSGYRPPVYANLIFTVKVLDIYGSAKRTPNSWKAKKVKIVIGELKNKKV